MIYVSPKATLCDSSQLLSSLQNATTAFKRLTNSTNGATDDTSSEEVCYSMYANICKPYFSVACRDGHSIITDPAHNNAFDEPRPTALETWGIGLLFICLVCSCAVFGVCLYPIMKKKFFHYVITWMIGLAVGSLSGIAVFQLIPQAFELGDETPEQVEKYIHKSLVIISSIYAFFLAERIFKLCMERRAVPTRELSQSTIQSAVGSDKGNYMTIDSTQVAQDISPADGKCQEESGCAVVENIESLEKERVHFHEHVHVEFEKGQPGIQTIAWLILSGDSIHKFVDGLSIGAAFSISTLQGVSIAIAVLCEELPHELGDLAILLHSGLTLKRAILYNSISGLTCFIGFAAGVFLGELPAATTWIFAIASGMFIYISFVNILPEMISAVEDAGRSSTRQAVLILSTQTFGLVVGIALMYILARFSGQIRIG
ncbi:Zinc transporter ZIP14 [Hypsibius exemplaris]|uniref:Zinc transporter ZIP14 n=1 Tax=Hypsibius exemplaris TaxID=2072580 RepID=A0A1W0XBY1_HYPEX|nr:Zinc transporter ZIP14 [Hypsibius exemplaris]